MLYKIYFKLDRLHNKFRKKKRPGFIFTAIAAVATAIAGAAASAFGLGLIGFGVAYGAAYVAVSTAVIFGGIALSTSGGKAASPGVASSPSYSSPTLQTQTNNDLPIPMIYGEVKLAGNRIWQNDSGESRIKRLVAFCAGENEDFTDIRLNDIPYTQITGCAVEKFYGTSTQQISTLIPGADNAARAEIVGSLKNIAYLAISCPKSDKINENYNLTTVVKGRKVRIYSDATTYTTAYSNNPAWCLLDTMIDYNGAGMALLNTGLISDTEIAKHIDILSYIEAADYCDELIAYYELTTALTGNNNDLIFKARSANDSTVSVKYTNAGASKALDITVTGKNIDIQLATNGSSVITTTANDIISLINNDADATALVKVCSADSNDGTGIVTVMAKTTLTGGVGQARFAFNMIFDSVFSVRDAIEEFKKNCRGALVTKGEKLQFKIDMPGDVVLVIDQEDIITGSEIYTPIPLEEHYDILKVKYISPEYEWAKVQAQAELFEYKNEPAISHSVDVFSITNHVQAALLGWYYLNKKILCPFVYTFSTDYRVYDREIGDIITVDSLLMGQIYTGKIVKIVDDGSGIFDVTIIPYDENLYNDEMASEKPHVIINPVNIDDKIRTATCVVAASNSSNKNQADYIVDVNSTSAQDVINAAIDSLQLQAIENMTCLTSSTATSIIFDTTAPTTDDYYNGLFLKFTSGNCADEDAKLITDYAGSTQTATVETFTNTPSDGDTFEIQAYSGKVLLLEGTYTVDDSILIKSGVTLEGMGFGTVVKAKDNPSDVVTFNIFENSNTTYGDNSFNLKNFRVDGNKKNQKDVYPWSVINAMKFKNIFNSVIADIKINNCIGSGVYFSETGDSRDNKLINCCISNCKNTALFITSNNFIVGGEISGNISSGIYLIGSNTSINNTVIKDNQVGISVCGFDGLTLSGILINGCTVIRSKQEGIAFTNVINSNISGCNVSYNKSGGIILNGNGTGVYASNNNVSSNACIGNKNDGTAWSSNIELRGNCSYNSIQNNVCRAVTPSSIPAYGIRLYATLGAGNMLNNIVSNNDLKDTVSYTISPLYDTGTGTIKNNNRT